MGSNRDAAASPSPGPGRSLPPPLCYRHPAGAMILRLAGAPMLRREFITLIGGAAAWPLAARAQQPERMRRIGVLMNFAAGDSAGQARVVAFGQELQHFGWTEGRNVRIDIRWGAGDAEQIRKSVAELLAFAPDVILTSGSPTTGPLLQATRTVPIVFVQVADPVGAGFVENLAHPRGNVTGLRTSNMASRANGLKCSNRLHRA